MIDIWLCCSSELCDPWPSWVNKLYPYLTWIYFLICSYNNERDLLASGILQMILGTGISMKYGSGGGSHKLSSAVCQATDRKCSVSRATPNSLSGKQWRNNKMCHQLFIALLNFGTDFIAINFQTKSCYKNILIYFPVDGFWFFLFKFYSVTEVLMATECSPLALNVNNWKRA